MKITHIIDKILLVDDDPVSNDLCIDLINKLGFAREIVVKQNGRDAISYLESECTQDETCPSLVLLDLMMPVLDGFDFLQEFERLDQKLKDKMIIIILTAFRNPEDIIRLRKMGRYYLITKPLTLDKLVDIYHRYFRNSPR
jgi:DNA-binding response OmpR family regulator